MEFSSEVLKPPEGQSSIRTRSLSPWSWRSTSVKNQIPSTVWEAECSSLSCSGPGPGPDPGQAPQNLNSVPVYQNILVLTRKDEGRCYVASLRSVAVGCTCVWARVHRD
ncbi:interleukin-17A-like [Menidia menidia]